MEFTELYEKYRPTSLDQVIGQGNTVAQIQQMLLGKRIPHAILLHGERGCGKTSLARIIRTNLACASALNYIELNAAESRGIDAIRTLEDYMRQSPINGPSRVAILDEVHQTTTDAQSCLLKMLEPETTRRYQHAYYLLCTTEPEKLKKTVRDRCVELQVRALSEEDLKEIVSRVCRKEGIKLDATVQDELIFCADGSARKALVYLHQIRDLKTVAEQLKAMLPPVAKENAFKLVGILLRGRSWAECLNLLEEIATTDDLEKMRRMVLTSAVTAMKTDKTIKGSARASAVIDAFKSDFFSSGKAGLFNACYELFRILDK